MNWILAVGAHNFRAAVQFIDKVVAFLLPDYISANDGFYLQYNLTTS